VLNSVHLVGVILDTPWATHRWGDLPVEGAGAVVEVETPLPWRPVPLLTRIRVQVNGSGAVDLLRAPPGAQVALQGWLLTDPPVVLAREIRRVGAS